MSECSCVTYTPDPRPYFRVEEPPEDACVDNLATGQIAYWEADTIPDTDEIGGRVLSSAGDVASVAGKIGNAFSFNGGGSSLLTCPDDAALRFVSASFTIRFWIRIPSLSSTGNILDKLDAAGGWLVSVGSPVPEVKFDIRLGDGSIIGGHTSWPLPVGSYSQVVITYNFTNGLLNFYFNAVIQANSFLLDGFPVSVPATPASYTGPLIIGDGLIGDIDLIGLWNFPWTVCEIEADYNNDTGRTNPFV